MRFDSVKGHWKPNDMTAGKDRHSPTNPRMLMNDQQIEEEIQTKRLTAPRITLTDIEANIRGEYYFTAQDGIRGIDPFVAQYTNRELSLLTFCILVLKNDFTVVGKSACASPENFDAEIGKEIAYNNAREKIWLLEGYFLKG